MFFKPPHRADFPSFAEAFISSEYWTKTLLLKLNYARYKKRY